MAASCAQQVDTSNANNLVTHHDAAARMEAWHFREPVRNQKGGMSVYIDNSVTDKRRPRIQCVTDNELPLKAPFGASCFEQNSASTRLNLELTIENPALLDFLQALDRHIPTVARRNCSAWFKKELSEAEILSMYRPVVNAKENSNFPPMMRSKINVASGRNQVRVHKALDTGSGMSHTKGTIDDITNDASYWPIIEISGMWFMSRQFGVSIVCTELLVFPSVKNHFPFLGNFTEALPDQEEEVSED